MSQPALAPSIPRRISARAIDYLVLAAAAGGLGTSLGFGVGWLLLTAVFTLAYFVVGDAAAGTTIGKAALGLRVEDATGNRPSVARALARESFVLLGAVPFVGPILALVAWVTLFVTIRRDALGQGWHDRWAGGTRVVKKLTK
jgi:uncharacterized RDD family membrane protein YckC